jgi:hypothetical protein
MKPLMMFRPSFFRDAIGARKKPSIHSSLRRSNGSRLVGAGSRSVLYYLSLLKFGV